MKLVRYGPPAHERPGLLDSEGRVRDLSGEIVDLSGEALHPDVLQRLKTVNPETLPVLPTTPRLGPCVGNVGKFLCIGLNYSDHAAETGGEVPPEPILFMKANSAISGPNDDIVRPRGSETLDYEVELGLVIGQRAKHVSEAEALDYLAGYCVVNDVSERNFQTKRAGQWTKGKSCDSFGPIGPWLVTRDEVPDPQALDIWLEVDGEKRQNGNTSTMIYGCAHIISYLSQFMTLYPGDVIATGTPPGVAMGMKPVRKYLEPGQEVRLGIAGLGEQRAKVAQEA